MTFILGGYFQIFPIPFEPIFKSVNGNFNFHGFFNLFISVLLVLMVNHLAAQDIAGNSEKNYVKESWSVENGLPVGHINQMYQTPDGYLWMATFDGLIRFDGVKFTRFDVSNTPGLPSNRIILIQPGQGNSFWLFTEQRNLVHVDKESFKSYGSFLSIENQRVILDGDSVTWVTSRNGILRFTGDKLVAGEIGNENTNFITAVFRRKDGVLIVTDNIGNIFRTRFPYRELHKVKTPQKLKFPEAILTDHSGKYWLSNTYLLKLEDDTTRVLNRDQLIAENWSGTPPLCYSILQDQQGTPWILAETGFFGVKNGHFYTIDDNNENSSYFSEAAMRQGGGMCTAPDGSVWTVFQKSVFRNGILQFTLDNIGNTIFYDSEGSIWITNKRFGVNRYSKALISHFLMEGKPSNFYGVYQDKNRRIWFGTWYYNVFYLNKDEGVSELQTKHKIAASAAFGEDADGNFYIGSSKIKTVNTSSDGLHADFERIPGLPNEIFAIYTSADSSMWYGTLRGLFKLKEDSAILMSDNDTIPDFPVRFILETPGKNLWLATNGSGVRKYNYDANTNRYFTKNDGLSSNNIRALLADEKGNIWVASEDRGLSRINPTTGEIVCIGKKDGLYSESLNGILLDDFNRLWMSTNEGIFWVDFDSIKALANGSREKIVSTVYTDRDGMLSRETNGGFQNSALKSKDGRLWFVTQKGLVCVNPSKIISTRPLPPVVIEDVLVDGKKRTSHDGIIQLDRETQNFTIKFTTPSYLAPNRIRFKYKLDGFNDKWIQSGNRREAIYTNIPGGNYTFQVAAFYDQSFAEANFTTLQIHKEALIIETWWFWVLVVIALLLVIYGIFKWRLHQLKMQKVHLKSEVHERTRELEVEQEITKAQKEKLEVLDREKSRFFANISHEFRTPLTLIISPLSELLGDPEILSIPDNQRNRMSVSLKNARRLMRLVEQLLEIARLETGNLKLDMELAPVNEYIAEIADTFLGLEEAKQVRFSIDIPTDPIFIEYDKEYLDKIIVNLLSNAFKFTPRNGQISLKVDVAETSVNISVTDSGLGISTEHLPHLFDRFYQVEKSEMQPGTGIGLSIMKEITELHNGEIEVVSTKGEGSTFTVSFPLVKPEKGVAQNPQDESIDGQLANTRNSIADTSYSPDIALDGEKDDDDQTTILIVDDNADIRSYVGESLGGQYNVVSAESGNAALSAIEKMLPDVIVSDVMMPDGDGMELLQKIRADKTYSFLPVILLTAKAEIEHKLEGLSIGADDYITKPFDIHELKLRIKNIIEARKRLKAVFFQPENTKSPHKVEIESEAVDSQDSIFLEKVKTAIREHFKDEDFTVESLSEMVGQSRSNLYRKLIQLTNESPSAMLKRIRLEQAAQLLKSEAGNVSEVAYACGFNSVSHFSKSFSKAFGVPPTSYAEKA